MSDTAKKSTQKKSGPFLKRLFIGIVFIFVFWTILWIAAYFGSKRVIQNFLLAPSSLEQTVKIGGYPFGFQIALTDYHLDLSEITGEQSSLDGDKLKLTWRGLAPNRLVLSIDGDAMFSIQGQTLKASARSGINQLAAGFGFSGPDRVQFLLADFSLLDPSGVLFEKPIQTKDFSLEAHGFHKRADLNLKLGWEKLNLPELPEHLSIFGDVIEDADLSALVYKFGQAMGLNGHLACNLNKVGGGLIVHKLKADWGDLKPRLSVILESDIEGPSGIIRILFKDIEKLFETIAPLFDEGATTMVELIKVALVNAEQNGAPFPVQVMNGQIRIASQGLLTLFSCPK